MDHSEGKNDKTIPRVKEIVEDLVDAISEVFDKHNVTFDEYRAGFFHVIKTGQANELGLPMDMLLCQRVCDIEMKGRKGTRSNVEGPYFFPDAPLVTDAAKVRGDVEPLQIQATVKDLDGNPIPDVDVDLWWADSEGKYSGYSDDFPLEYFRCKVKTDKNGQYSILGSMPVEYPITTARHGPTGGLVDMLGRQGMRTKHMHQKYNKEGYLPLTTQAYFRGAKFIDEDPVTAVFEDLIYDLKEEDGIAVLDINIVLDPD